MLICSYFLIVENFKLTPLLEKIIYKLKGSEMKQHRYIDVAVT